MSIDLKNQKGFTIVELIISLGIFALMTALLVTKYGNFNQGILLNNLAYDIALNIRNAQSYGLNVKSAPDAQGSQYYSDKFNYPYGVNFTSGSNTFILYADINNDGVYTEGTDIIVSSNTIRKVGTISNLCVRSGSGQCTIVNPLNISFKRPDPNAIIRGGTDTTNKNYAQITLRASDGSIKKIIVRSTGQIDVESDMDLQSNQNTNASHTAVPEP